MNKKERKPSDSQQVYVPPARRAAMQNHKKTIISTTPRSPQSSSSPETGPAKLSPRVDSIRKYTDKRATLLAAIKSTTDLDSPDTRHPIQLPDSKLASLSLISPDVVNPTSFVNVASESAIKLGAGNASIESSIDSDIISKDFTHLCRSLSSTPENGPINRAFTPISKLNSSSPNVTAIDLSDRSPPSPSLLGLTSRSPGSQRISPIGPPAPPAHHHNSHITSSRLECSSSPRMSPIGPPALLSKPQASVFVAPSVHLKEADPNNVPIYGIAATANNSKFNPEMDRLRPLPLAFTDNQYLIPESANEPRAVGLVNEPNYFTNSRSILNFEDYNDIINCCIVAEGFHNDLPEFSKSLILKPFTDRGALLRWISPHEVLMVFSTPAQAMTAFSAPKNSLIRTSLLSHLNDRNRIETLAKVGKEIQVFVKPERDTRVANRMIGAALGIRVPTSKPPERVSIPPLVFKDAWDD